MVSTLGFWIKGLGFGVKGRRRLQCLRHCFGRYQSGAHAL